MELSSDISHFIAAPFGAERNSGSWDATNFDVLVEERESDQDDRPLLRDFSKAEDLELARLRASERSSFALLSG